MSKEFYSNLNKFFVREEDDNLYDLELGVEMDEKILEEEYNKILPELNQYNENLDLSNYIK